MSQKMFETNIAALLPEDPKTAAPDLYVSRGVQILLADTNRRVTQLEADQQRLLDLLEQMVEMDKIRAQAFDALNERVKRAAVHAGLRQQAIDALNDRISKLERSMTNESVI